jgi:glycosyltransferase involved in cell wall biosynthesis
MPNVLQMAAAVVTVSEHSKRDIALHYRVAEERIHVVYNGVDHALFNPSAKLGCALAAMLGLRPDYVLHVGSLAHRKNIPTLLRAVALLKAKGGWGKRQLVLAGPHTRSLPGHEEIRNLILQLGLQMDVVLTGYLSTEDIAGLYAGAGMLVMSSLYEGFGFPLVEAMAVGTPVLASNVSSIPEICDGAALFFSPYSAEELAGAMNSVLKSPILACELKRKGLKRAQQFTWQRAAEQTANVYRRVLS